IGKSRLLRDATDAAAERGFSLAAGAADQLGLAIPFFALRAALREPFAGLTAGHPDRDLPEATAWWITQMRAHLEQRAAAAPLPPHLEHRPAAPPLLLSPNPLHSPRPPTLPVLPSLPQDLKRHPVGWLLPRSTTPHPPSDYLFGHLKQHGPNRIVLPPLDQDA